MMSVEREMAVDGLGFVDLDVVYRLGGEDRQVLRSLSLAVSPGESCGLVGESGCGKTTAALAAVRYLPRNGRVTGGHVRVNGMDPYRLSGAELRRFRRDAVSMVYQNPGTALNPSIRIGRQIREVFEVRGVEGDQAIESALASLRSVHIADPESVLMRYPRQLSGGMQQRVVIAMALAANPAVLILDEPTTGLDITVEAEILDLINELQASSSIAALFITHNLGVIAKTCQRVGVLYAGRLVEEGPARAILRSPRHPYTALLIRCIPARGDRRRLTRLESIPGLLPRLGERLPGCVFADRCPLAEEICRYEEPPLHEVTPGWTSRCHFHDRIDSLPSVPVARTNGSRAFDRGTPALATIDGVTKVFHERGSVHALNDISFSIWPGETIGVVGESGSGKTTLAHVIAGMVEPTSGTVGLGGVTLAKTATERGRDQLRSIQLVFQNPDSALNRSHSVERILKQALGQLAGIKGERADRRVAELTSSVHLAERYLNVRPRHLSGGLKQRLAIACAFAGDPRLVICDEPTSALDVSVQAAILNLLSDLQTDRGVSYLFISHDLGVVRYISDRIIVMYLGKVMEMGDATRVFTGPHHPYTESLLSALPTIDGGETHRLKLRGEPPSAASLPPGCVFQTRCHRKLGAVCEVEEPPLREVEPGHLIRCHIPVDDLGRTSPRDA